MYDPLCVRDCHPMYVPLCVRSCHSIHVGASTVNALTQAASRFGIRTLVLTDENNFYGAVKFFQAARDAGIKPVLGAIVSKDAESAVLLVQDERGYANLCHIISCRNLDDGFQLDKAVAENSEGLFILVRNRALLERLAVSIAPERIRAEVIRPVKSQTEERALLDAVTRLGVKPVASTDIHFAMPQDFQLHRVLYAIGQNGLLDDVQGQVDCRKDAYLHSVEEMKQLFHDMPEVLKETVKVAEQCNFDLLGRKPVFPKVAENSADLIRSEVYKGAERMYGGIRDEVRRRIEHELALIIPKGFADYFLIVADIVCYAKSLGTPVAGRGSGASSIVAYLLGITNVDPLKYNLPFERFLNEHRKDYPDLDIDFCWRLRDDVIGYVYKKYGDRHVAMVSTHTTYQKRGAIREALKVLGVSDYLISRVLPKIELADGKLTAVLPVDSGIVQKALEIANQLEGLPGCISVHCGGVVITPGDIDRHAPLQRAEKGVVITQYEKDAVETVGLVKLDLLGNRALTNIAESARLAGVDTEQLSEDDAETIRLLAAGDTLGVNQLESPAMRRLLMQMRPKDVRTLMQALALIRPGAAMDGMKEEFVRRRHGISVPEPLDKRLAGILSETHGMMLYEDDVLLVAEVMAGYSRGEADVFRRSLKKCRSKEEEISLCKGFVAECVKNGFDEKFARNMLVQMARFTKYYSFCRAHAASYARLAWMNAYMKAHYPAAFWIGALNNNQGLYPKWVYMEEARRMGIRTLLPCVNSSGAEFSIENGALRIGLSHIKDLPETAIKAVLANRPFDNLADLLERTGIGHKDAEVLIRAGALDFTGTARPALLRELYTKSKRKQPCHKNGMHKLLNTPISASNASGDYDDQRKWTDEWELLGLSVRYHPIAPVRSQLDHMGMVKSGALSEHVGQGVSVAGLIATGRQTRTSKGETMLFLTLSDEEGLVEVVIMPDVYRRYKRVLSECDGKTLVVEGVVEVEYDTLTLQMKYVQPLSCQKRPVSPVLRHTCD